MYDVQLVLQELQSPHSASRHPRKYVFRHACSLEFVHAAGVHVLHTVVHARFDEESTVELNDFWRNGAIEDVQLHDDRI